MRAAGRGAGRAAAAAAAVLLSGSVASRRQRGEVLADDSLVLKHALDRYQGCLVNDPASLPRTAEEFNEKLAHSLDVWRAEKRRGIWLTLSPETAGFVGEAIKKHGFELHSADKDKLLLTKWLPGEEGVPNSLPAPASHYVGIGCLLLNSTKDKMLVVQEKNGVLRGSGFYKIPTGTVEAGEDLASACVRELKEETGIDAEVKGLVLFRHATQFLNGKGDLFFVFLMKLPERSQDQQIVIQESEIADAKWIPLEDYFGQSLAPLWPAARVAYTKMNQTIKDALDDPEGRVWQLYSYSEKDKSAIFSPPPPTPTPTPPRTR